MAAILAVDPGGHPVTEWPSIDDGAFDAANHLQPAFSCRATRRASAGIAVLIGIVAPTPTIVLRDRQFPCVVVPQPMWQLDNTVFAT